MEVRRLAGTDPVALELVAAMVSEMGGLYEPGLARTPLRPEELSPPGVPDYNANPYASFWGEKRLARAGAAERGGGSSGGGGPATPGDGSSGGGGRATPGDGSR